MHSTCQQHLATANAMGYRPKLPWWKHCHAAEPRQLYRHMLDYGLDNLVVLPLQLLPDTATDHEVFEAEQRWIHRLNSTTPNGYNARAARRGVPRPGQVCTARYYGSRDMCRRVYFCYSSFVKQRLLPATLHQFFASYHTKTLHSMFAFCSRGGADDVAAVADPSGYWQVPGDFVPQLRSWLSTVIAARLDRPPAQSAQKRLVVFTYWGTIMDKLDFRTALHQPAALQLLTPAQRHLLPVIGFRYNLPFGPQVLQSRGCGTVI